MKKAFIILISLFLWTGLVFGQLVNYEFTQLTSTYTEITGGTVLGNTTSDDQRFVDPATPLGGTVNTGVGFPIGFNFVLDGQTFDRFAVNANGWISLGKSSLTPSVNINTSSAYTPLGSTTAIAPAELVSRIALMGRDLNAQTGAELRFETVGSAPNRILVVQWKNYRKYNAAGDSYNGQIRLYETTNIIELIYGTMTNNATSTTLHVGLRGAPATPASNFNNRTTTTNWQATTSGGAATASVTISNTVFPPSGLVFRWKLATCFPPTALTVNTITTNSATISWTAPTAAPASGYQWEVRTSGAAGSGATGLAASGTTAAGVLTANVTGLTPGTNFSLYVRSNCGGGDFSPWAGPVAFSTPVPPITVFPHQQSFDDVAFAPPGWLNFKTAGGGTPGIWDRQTAGTNPTMLPQSGPGMARFYCYNYSAGTKGELVSAPFNFPTNMFKVTFWMYRDNGYPTDADRVNVYHNVTPSSTGGTLLGTINRSINLSPTVSANGWYEYGFNLPTGSAGVGYIIFEGVSAFGNNIFVDDVTVKERQEGTLRGTITDCYTNAVIEGATVNIGSLSTTTNASGYYEFAALDIGTFNMTVTKAGYFNKTLSGVNVFINEITTQNACLNQFVDPPVNLEATVAGRNVQLEWDAPGSPTNEWIMWDNGINSGNSIGTNAPANFDVASRWPVGDIATYDGYYLKKVRFFPREASCTYTIKVWKGVNAAELLHSQVVTSPVIGAWNEITLTSPILIDGASEFWFGYNVNTTIGYPAGCDDGPVVAGKGNMIYWSGTWQELTALNPALTYNWNLTGFVSPFAAKGHDTFIPLDNRIQNLTLNEVNVNSNSKESVSNEIIINQGDLDVFVNPITVGLSSLNDFNLPENKASTATLTGYNIYRGTTKIASNITPLTYTDMNLTAGTYAYSVTAQYVEGESMPDGPVSVQVITCFQPINITATNITTTTATIGWTPGASETSWEYVIGLAPLAAPTAAGTPTSSNSVNLSSLIAGRSYQIYVRSTCGGTDGNSTWTGPYTFSTECEPVVYQLMETFEVTSPTVNCWLAYNQDAAGKTWVLSTAQNHTVGGSRSAVHNYTAGVDEDGWLVSPAISIPSVGTTELKFWSYNAFPTWYFKNSVLVSTGSPDPADDEYVEIWSPESVTSIWTETVYDLSAYTGEIIYIAFRYEGNDAHDWFLDDVSVKTLLGATATPTDLSCNGSADGSIILDIYGGVPPYNVFWSGPDGFSSSMQSISGLAAGSYSYAIDDQEGTILNGFVDLNQPAAVPVPIVANLTVVYDGLVKTIVATAPADTELVWYDAAVGGEESSAPSASEAGVYTAWVAAVDLDGCESARIEVILTIEKKPLTVTADNQLKCQNTPNPELTYVFSGFITGEGPGDLDALPVGATTALFNSLPGIYPITLSGGMSNNYSFVYVNGNLTVTASPIVDAGGPGFVCVSETFPIVSATASNYTTILWSTAGNGSFNNPNIVNPVYTPGSQDITNGTVVLTMTGDPGSTCSASDQVLLTIQNDLPVSVTIVLNTIDICIGTPVSFSALPVNGGLTPSYQWKVNGTNAGTNDDEFTYVPNNGDVVTVVLTSSIGCALNNPATSNALTVNVTPNLTALVSITASDTDVCDFTPVTFTASPVNGGTNPAYQWKVNGVNQGLNASVFTYAPLNGDIVTVVITSNHPCAVAPVATSNAITMTVSPPLLVLIANPVNGGTVSGGGNFAQGSEVTVTAVPTGGWEFLNWKNIDGAIVSTDAVYTFTIYKCYEELTATFSSTAKIAGQLKYFNAAETIIPSPNSSSVFYVQLFENGTSIGDRQLVKYNFETGLDSYYEYIGVESGKDYTLRLWEENTNNLVGNNWTWNNWGGATSIDALIINYMTVESQILTAFPWVMPSSTSGFTPFATKVANVNNDNNVTALDALVLMNRIVGNSGFNPFPGGAHNFQLGTLKLANHSLMAYPTAPSIMFSPFGVYDAASEATSVYYEALLTGLNDGLNVFNIYLTATGDVNASNVPGGSKSAEILTYENVISANVGDEILIPVRINQSTELGAITIGMSYNNQLIDVVDVIGYDIFNINKAAGEVHIAWFDQNGKSFGQNQEVVVLKAKVIAEINQGVRFAELLSTTEFANVTASVLQGISLSTSYVETSATSVGDLNVLSLDHSIFPNPFNDYTSIHYTLPSAGKVSVVVYNHLGQEVKALFNGTQIAGAHALRLNNYDLNGSGTYFYRIILEGETKTLSARGTIMMAK